MRGITQSAAKKNENHLYNIFKTEPEGCLGAVLYVPCLCIYKNMVSGSWCLLFGIIRASQGRNFQETLPKIGTC